MPRLRKKALGFRHADHRYPFLWEGNTQPEGRWHGPGQGPAHYFADTPDGAWAEFLRHEGIKTVEDLAGITRTLWVVELPAAEEYRKPTLTRRTMRGPTSSYLSCQKSAKAIRSSGCRSMVVPSAALKDGKAGGWRVDGGLKAGRRRNGKVIVLFEKRPDLVGWRVVHAGRPNDGLLNKVRHFPR